MTNLAILREQFTEHTSSEFNVRVAWMKADVTKTLVRDAFTAVGVSSCNPQCILALFLLATDDEALTDTEHDVIMRTEAKRFHASMEKLFDGDASTISEDLRRAMRFYAAWRNADIPHTLDQLLASAVAHCVRQRDAGVAEESIEQPEDIFSQIRMISPEAEAEARQRCRQMWRPVRREDMTQTIAQVAQRAFWDVIQEQISQGDYSGLFHVLEEARGALNALAVHMPSTLEDLDDKFDVAFIRQQAEHGALETENVHGLMQYLIDVVSRLQAPVDDENARTWKENNQSIIDATKNMALDEFICAHLLTFLSQTIERLQLVYTRMIDFAETMHNND